MKRIKNALKNERLQLSLICFAIGLTLMFVSAPNLSSIPFWRFAMFLGGVVFTANGWEYLFHARKKTPPVVVDQQRAQAEQIWRWKEEADLDEILAEGLICKCGHKKSHHCIAPSVFPLQLQAMMNHCHADHKHGEDQETLCPCPAFLLATEGIDR